MASRVLRGPWSRHALDRQRAEQLRNGITSLFGAVPGAPAELLQFMLLLVDQRTQPSSRAKRGGRFAIVDPAFNAAVVCWAFDNAKRPRVTIKLWMEMQSFLLPATNEVQMDRGQMMEAAGASSAHVSAALSELAAIRAVERIKNGREVRWRVTTLAATHLAGAAREKAQEAEPALLAAIRTAGPQP